MSLLKIYEQQKQSSLVPVVNHDNAPIISSYNDHIRPLLDTVDNLRHLKIMQEGIQLPTIVVVGDQSSGKSSVLESLTGISLPRGQGICTQVPLIMRLQNHQNPNPDLSLEFNGKTVPTNEENISKAISLATEEIAGQGKGISNSPLTLVVKKNGFPDLTMVDLPGITRVPVHGQPDDIYEQISKIIIDFITPEESIILNVFSASVNFSTCESIIMSQQVDKTGQRTLAVVTKSDESPEGLLEKVAANDVNIGLGYVCVRNRIGDETYEEARAEEARLFETHPQLSKINKSIVGTPVLAERLVKIQATIIVKCLNDVVGKINDKLSADLEEMNKMPSVAEVMTTFMHILGNANESLRKILLQGEFDEYPDAKEMHGTTRLAEMLNNYFEEFQFNKPSTDGSAIWDFLVDEIELLEEAKSIGLPNFQSKSIFLMLLDKKVNSISDKSVDFVEKTWSYIENIVTVVHFRHFDNYPQLLSDLRKAVHNLISKKKEQSIVWVKELVQMEKVTDYTCNPEYMASFNKLMSNQSEFLKAVESSELPWIVSVEGFGKIDVYDLYRTPKSVVKEAFDLKMRITAYWKIVMQRMVDNIALHLQYNIQKLVKKEMQTEMINEWGNRLERIWEKQNKLKKSIKLLKESKNIIANIGDLCPKSSFNL